MRVLLIAFAFIAFVVGNFALMIVVARSAPDQAPEPVGIYGFLYQELALIAAVLLGTLVFVFSWVAVGRAPKSGDLSLEFEPPNGLGPAALRFVHERCFDPLCATAAVISMAVKGALRIVEEPVSGSPSKHSLRLEPAGAAGKGLTTAEQATYDALFPSDVSLPLRGDETEGAQMDQARAKLEAELRKDHDGATFRWNLRYSMAAASVGIVGAFVLLLTANQSLNYPFLLSLALTFAQMKLWLIAVFASYFVLSLYAAPWFLPLVSRITLKDILVHFGISTIIAGAVLALAYWLIDPATASRKFIGEWILLGSGAFFGAVIAIFSRLMGATTKSGRRLMDRIRGFGLYLEGKEKGLAGHLGHPKATPALFERFLPYAAALDLAKEWRQQFDGAIKPTWCPAWYRGSAPFDAVRIVKSLNSAISATSEVSAAARRRRGWFMQRFGGLRLQPRY